MYLEINERSITFSNKKASINIHSFWLVFDYNKTDAVDLKQIANEFVARDSSLQNMFGTFTQILPGILRQILLQNTIQSMFNKHKLDTFKHPQTKELPTVPGADPGKCNGGAKYIN